MTSLAFLARYRRRKILRGSVLCNALLNEISLSHANTARLTGGKHSLAKLADCADDLEREYDCLRLKVQILRSQAQGAEKNSLHRLLTDLNAAGTSFFFKWQERIKLLAKRLTGYQYGSPINEERIRRWLRQFGDPSRMEYALQLLDNLEFVSFESYASVVRTFYRGKLSLANRGFVYPDLLVGAESTPILQSIFRKAMERCGCVVNGKNCTHIKQMLSGRRPLFRGKLCLLADDIIGSGKQYVDVFKALLNDKTTSEKDKAKYFARQQRLGRVLRQRFSELEGYLVVYAVCAGGLSRVADFLRQKCPKLELVTLVGRTPQKCFDANQSFTGERLFRSDAHLQKAMMMCRDIGKQLWDEDNALGFQGSQQLVVFSHNVPNNTLPILWKLGSYNGEPWMPLFERPGKKK